MVRRVHGALTKTPGAAAHLSSMSTGFALMQLAMKLCSLLGRLGFLLQAPPLAREGWCLALGRAGGLLFYSCALDRFRSVQVSFFVPDDANLLVSVQRRQEGDQKAPVNDGIYNLGAARDGVPQARRRERRPYA